MAFRRKLAGLGAALGFLVLAGSATAETDDSTRARELWSFCQSCHGAEGGGNELYFAPAIAGMPAWYVERQLQKFHSGGRGTNFDDITGMRMRPMALWLTGEADFKLLGAFVGALPPVKPAPTLIGGDAARGQALYAPCTACHGAEGKGMEVLGAPPLDHQSDWYMLSQLEKFKSGIRGTNPQDIQGMQMRPMSMLLADQQAMKDVIAYIVTLGQKTQAAKE